MEAERAVGPGETAEQTRAAPEGRLPAARRGVAAALRNPVALTIAIATLLALGLRVYYLSRPGFLFGVTEYDDGPYFGSAVRLTQGIMPYRDFVLVQPPGITLLMLPAALLAKITGTAWGMAIGRMLTVLAGVAGVVVAGLLVRHRGVLATLVACGVLAVFPDSVSASHTVLVEPWLVLFCLIGAVLVFDEDRLVTPRPAGGQLSGRKRLILGGLAFGFAGAIETWAIVPVLVVVILCVAAPVPGESRGPGQSRLLGGNRLRRAVPFVAGVAAGFGVPVLPFAAAAPGGFYQSLIVAQVGPRSGSTRVPLLSRLTEMSGLTDIRLPLHVLGATVPDTAVVWTVTIILLLLAVGGPALLNLITGELPTALEWFALASTELIIVMFLWPLQFHYHFADFLAAFLGLAIALPTQRLLALVPGRRLAGRRLTPVAVGLTAALIALFTFLQAKNESGLTPVVGPAAIAQAKRIIPPGSCVLSDSAALLLVADRFVSDEPGCGVIDDGLGTDLALSHGLTPATGAAGVPAVARLWAQAFDHAQFVWFSAHSWRRVAWPPAVLAYFQRDFRPVLTDRYGDTLYRRVHGHTG